MATIEIPSLECSNCGSATKIQRGSYALSEMGLANATLEDIGIVKCESCGNEDPIISNLDSLMRLLTSDEFESNVDAVISCQHKLQHKSAEAAEKARASMEKKKGEPFEAYKCRHCEFWHIGHSS